MAATLESVKVGTIEIPLIYEEERTLPIVSAQIVFTNAGSLSDPIPGTAKIASRILNEGSKRLGSVGFAKALEEKAIMLQVGNGYETMTLDLSSLKENFPHGVALVAELLSDPNLTPATFKKVKTMARASLLRKENDYDYLADAALKALLFPITPLAYPQNGTLESLEKITLTATKTFITTHLTKRNAIVVIGGDVTLQEAKEAAIKILSSLPEGAASQTPRYSVSATGGYSEIIKPETQQAYLYFGAPLNLEINSPDAYKGKVASFILGASGFGSRLMEEIRVKRGLAYSAYGRFQLNKSHSLFSGYLQTKLASQAEAQKIVREVVAEFVKHGATAKELEGAKKFLLGSEPLRNETLSQRLSRSFTEYYNGLKLGFSKEELTKISNLTLDELNSFIASHGEIANLSFAIVTAKPAKK
ncbi:MAG: insulinase family protein [Campylobacterales bacterium]